jgi:hypothetical protein
VAAASAHALNNGQARTPPMGFDAWNAFFCQTSAQLIEQTADAMVSSGMRRDGYKYLNIDDCWMAPHRDSAGNLVADPTKFPHGIQAVARYVHSRGLKLGIYEDSGYTTCAGFPGSFGHERQDATLFAAWGIDYVKYDWCHHPALNYAPSLDQIKVAGRRYAATAATRRGSVRVQSCAPCTGGEEVDSVGDHRATLTFTDVRAPRDGRYRLTIAYLDGDPSPRGTPSRLALVTVDGRRSLQVGFRGTGGWLRVGARTILARLHAGRNTIEFSNPLTTADAARLLDTRMGDALLATRRAIVFSVCTGWDPAVRPWLSARPIANLWRTTPDIHDTYSSMLSNFRANVALAAFAGPGSWNDPDMLEIGNGGMTDTEYRSEFSLWAEMAAPLIAGTDVRTMSPATKAIYTNRAVIAVDQDTLGIQGRLISRHGGHDVLSKPLAGGDRAVVLFNEDGTTATFGANAAQLGLPRTRRYLLHDLWTGARTLSGRRLSATVPGHGVVMWRVSVS